MTAIPAHALAGTAALVGATGPWLGKAAFVGVFVVLLIWLCLMPGRLIGRTEARPRWWRNARLWAIAVTVIQIVIYLRWG
jgi:hypothetical protein